MSCVLPSVYLFTPFEFSHAEAITVLHFSPSLQFMSVPNHTPLTLFRHVTDFIRAQNGSQTQKQLLPSLVEAVSRRTRAAHTEHDFSELIRKSQDSVRRFRSVVQRRKAAAAAYKAVKERLDNPRLKPETKAAIERDSAHIIRAGRRTPAPKQTTRGLAEERLVKALGELKEKNARWAAEAKQNEEEAKRRKREQKQEEKKAREEREAAEKEEKKKAEQERREREVELRTRQTDVRAMQVLDAKTKQMDLEKERKKEAERRERIDNKLEKVLDLLIADRGGRKRKKREEADESESDKENVEPEGEWQV